MDGELFYKWFSEVFLPFVKPLEERNGRKVILIYDGAAVHTSYALSKQAVDNGVILLKLPANFTHFMQPLDKCVFKPIKTRWNNEIIKYNRDFPGKILPNDEFSLKIKIIWEEAFKAEYLISGFRSTGIFPTNYAKFPEEAYDILKLKRFKDLENPRTVTSDEEPLPSTSTSEDTQAFEEFIRTKLTENLNKKVPESKHRQRISQNIGDILTSSRALSILKERENINV